MSAFDDSLLPPIYMAIPVPARSNDRPSVNGAATVPAIPNKPGKKNTLELRYSNTSKRCSMKINMSVFNTCVYERSSRNTNLRGYQFQYRCRPADTSMWILLSKHALYRSLTIQEQCRAGSVCSHTQGDLAQHWVASAFTSMFNSLEINPIKL